jgi:hypothetical protein
MSVQPNDWRKLSRWTEEEYYGKGHRPRTRKEQDEIWKQQIRDEIQIRKSKIE